MRGTGEKNVEVDVIKEIQLCTKAPISWKSTREAMYSNYMGRFFFVIFFFSIFCIFSFNPFFFCISFFFFFLFVLFYCCFYLVFEIFFFYLQKVKRKKVKVAQFSQGQQPQINGKKKAGKILPSITSTLKYPLVNHVGESQYCRYINHYN